MRRFLAALALLAGSVVANAQVVAPPVGIILTKHSSGPQVPLPFAVWSLRLVEPQYGGPLATLRCSSPAATENFYPTGTGDFPVVAALAFCPAGTLFVVDIYDQSGGGHTLANSNTANQPSLVLSVAALNNRPGILFTDGSALALGTSTIATSVFGAGGFISTVYNMTAAPIALRRIWQHGGNVRLQITIAGKFNFLQAYSVTSGQATTANAQSTTGVSIISVAFNAGNAWGATTNPTITVGNVVDTWANTAPSGTLSAETSASFFVGNSALTGGTSGPPMYFGEMWVFIATPSAGQQQSLYTNQAGYW